MIPAGSPNIRNVFPVVVQCGDRSSLPPFFPSYPPSFNLVFIKHLLYAKQLLKVSACTISLHLLTNLSRKIYQLCSPLAFQGLFMASSPTQFPGAALGSSLLLLFLSPTSNQLPALYLESGSFFLSFCLYLSPRHKSLFTTGLLPPGYHSIRGSVDSPAQTQNYVIPIVSIIKPEFPSLTLRDCCLSHLTTY